MVKGSKGFAVRRFMVGGSLIASLFWGVAFASETVNYEYDEAGRLVKVIRASDGKEESYSYDDADNRISKAVVAAPPPNQSPECENSSTYLGSVPPSASPVSITLQDSSFLNLCSDPDNDTLTVLTPSTPYSFTVAAGQTVNVSFTVSDGKGGTDGGTFTFSRP